MNSKIKVTTKEIQVTARIIEETEYTTTDGAIFKYKQMAKNHQHYLDTLPLIANIPEINGWYWVSTPKEVNLICTIASGGNSGRHSNDDWNWAIDDPFPLWVKIVSFDLWSDNGYGDVEVVTLTRIELEEMLKRDTRL